MIHSVCVYCGSSGHADDVYKDSAKALGKILAQKGWNTVYGGASVGLMGILADSALAHGGRVVGIMSQNLVTYEIDHKDLSEIHIVDTMHRRKQMMVDLSDAFVILPGGVGTLDEFFELLTWKQIGMHDKPVVIVNVNGFWTTLLKAIEEIAAAGFMRSAHDPLFVTVKDVADVPGAILNAPKSAIDPKTKWI